MDVLVFLFGIWFAPAQVAELVQHKHYCLIEFSGGTFHRVRSANCDDVARDINRAARELADG